MIFCNLSMIILGMGKFYKLGLVCGGMVSKSTII